MSKDPKILAQHILESIESLEKYTKDFSKEEFLANPEKQDAVVRRLEIIGEAAGSFPKEFQKKNPEIR